MNSRLRRLAVALGFAALIPACDHPSASSPTAPMQPVTPAVREIWSGTTTDAKLGEIGGKLTIEVSGSEFHGDLERIYRDGFIESGNLVVGRIEGSTYRFQVGAHDGDCVLTAAFLGTRSDALLEGSYTVTRVEKLCRYGVTIPFEGTFRFTRQN